MPQNKQKEIAFFDGLAREQGHDAFSEAANRKIVETVSALASLKPGFLVADLGCGSGVFTERLSALGCRCVGLDLSEGLAQRGRQHVADVPFVVGDVERLPFPSGCFDAVLLSGIVHHLPDPVDCARETFRILKPGGAFVAFDPNRRNPFMYLYRDRSSPFYSQVGVTENERPVISTEVARIFGDAGFSVKTNYLSGLHYRYIASGALRWALPVYNAIDDILFRPKFMKPFSAFVFTNGIKP